MADILEFKKRKQAKPRKAWTCVVCAERCQDFKIMDNMRVMCSNCGQESDLLFATHTKPVDEEGEYRGG